jgi:enoyl-CoA hydratase/carnithine racemase
VTEQGPGTGGAAQSGYRKITTSTAGDVAVLTLANGKVNALDVDMVEEILAFVEQCEGDAGVAALVVTGRGKVFSAGLNVRELLEKDPEYSVTLLKVLARTLEKLFSFPKPTVAAINGAAVAGGCLLACTCDARIIAEGARIGVTEVQVGVALPIVAVELMRYVCGPPAERLMLEAQLATADEACATGMAHRQAPVADLLSEAVAQAERLATGDARAYALAKQASHRSVLQAAGSKEAEALNRVVWDQWQSEETRARLGKLLEGAK